MWILRASAGEVLFPRVVSGMCHGGSEQMGRGFAYVRPKLDASLEQAGAVFPSSAAQPIPNSVLINGTISAGSHNAAEEITINSCFTLLQKQGPLQKAALPCSNGRGPSQQFRGI